MSIELKNRDMKRVYDGCKACKVGEKVLSVF